MSVLFKHKDKYDRVAGAYRPVVFYPKPDWENSVTITDAEFSSGYTCPADGFINIELQGYTASILLNGRAVCAWNGATYLAVVTVPVSAGDVIKAEGVVPGGYDSPRRSFIPWKLD